MRHDNYSNNDNYLMIATLVSPTVYSILRERTYVWIENRNTTLSRFGWRQWT